MTPEEEAYIKRLQSHDWYYEYSDDHSVWRRGQAERDQLRGQQRSLDPDGEIWNTHAPDMFKITPPAPKPITLLPAMNVKKRGQGPAP